MLTSVLALICLLLTLQCTGSLYSSRLIYSPRISQCASVLQAVRERLVLDGLAQYLDQSTRPKHIDIPRKSMELPFAILLMRSSYNAVDELDFVPMTEFQKTFFLFRQSEWELYKQFHPNVIQGILSDPYYFDFISFAQYAVISDKIKLARSNFIETINAQGDTIVVNRDTRLVPDEMLTQLHGKIVGNKIIEYLYSTYPTSALPDNSTTLVGNDGILGNENAIIFTKYLQLMLDLFSINNYALDMKVSVVADDSTDRKNEYVVKIKSVLPVTLWSSKALANRRDSPTNNFEIKATASLATTFSIDVDVIDTIFDEINVIHILKIKGKKRKFIA